MYRRRLNIITRSQKLVYREENGSRSYDLFGVKWNGVQVISPSDKRRCRSQCMFLIFFTENLTIDVWKQKHGD